MNLPQPATRPLLIAGQHCGKPVSLMPHLIADYNRLKAAAKGRNYWAEVALQGLHALQTGVIGKDNIYVKDGGFPRGLQQFRVLLPGLIAIVERRSDDRYCVLELRLSECYFVAKDLQKTGLYRVERNYEDSTRKTWKVEHLKKGAVLAEKNRAVAVADMGYEDAAHAAKQCGQRLPAAPNVGPDVLDEDGFDLHFTSGPKRLGGWRCYNALVSDNDSTYQSAFLLADTMLRAKGIAGVQWVSEFGGSVILTQAMKILADQGVTLNGHRAFMYKPKTSPDQAVRLAHRLGMTLNKDFAETGFNPIGAISKASSGLARIRDSNDRYGVGHCAQEWLSGIIKTAGVLGAGAASAHYLGPAIPALAAMAGIVGVVGTASTLISAAESTGKLGKGVVESTAHMIKIKK